MYTRASAKCINKLYLQVHIRRCCISPHQALYWDSYVDLRDGEDTHVPVSEVALGTVVGSG